MLFADISGFTDLSDRLDAEEVHAILNRYFDVVDGVVETYGGTVDKHIGDGLMAVFGAPVAHGDDPERAVRAAAEIHRAAAALDPPLRVHMGVASGEVVASGTGSAAHREYTVTGTTVNLAARLQDKAAPGETLLSDDVRRAVAGIAECAAVGRVAIRGLKNEVAVWRLVSVAAGRGREAAPAFVGRRAELRQFGAVLDACLEDGRGQTIYVRGEAGIGKTRLTDEFLALARRAGFSCHTGLVLDFGVGKGQDAIRTVVRSLLDIPPGADKALRRRRAEEAMADGLVPADGLVHLYDLLDLSKTVELRAVYDAMDNRTRNRGRQETVVGLVRTLAGRRPLAIRIEDMHWADAAMREQLVALSAAVATCPALLIATSRVEADTLARGWLAATAGAPVVTIDLSPLRREEALELAGAYLEASDRLAETCVERAAGNPLFLDQLLRSADEAVAVEGVPGTIQSIVQARIDRLDRRDKRALQAASVAGQRFTLDLLRHLLEDPGYDCAALVAHSLVRPERDGYLFGHDLIRRGVYSSLLRTTAQKLHRRAADWFADRDPVLRAEHLAKAGDPGAPRAYLAAAEHQAAQYRYDTALEMVTRGLDLAAEDGDRCALTLFLGRVRYGLGEFAESIEAYRAALDLASTDRERTEARIGMAEGMRVVDRLDEALAALAAAERSAGPELPADQAARLHHLRGNLYFPLGNIDGCLEEHRRALECAEEAGSREAEALALGGLGDAYYVRGRMATAFDAFDRCVTLCREHGFGRVEVANLCMRGFTRMFQNDFDGAMADYGRTVEAARKVGAQRAELVARNGIGWVHIYRAEWAALLENAERGSALVDRLGARRFEPIHLMHRARALAEGGERDAAIGLLRRAYAICEETGITFVGPKILGELALVEDSPEARRRALSEGEKLLESDCVAHNYFDFYADAIEVSLALGDWDEARRYADALEAYTRAEPLAFPGFVVARGRALAAFGEGRRDGETLAELRRCEETARRVGLNVALPALEAALAA